MSQRNVGYWPLLRHNPEFTRLWIGQLVSNLGDWFNTVAVLALVYDLTQSGLSTGLIIIASTLPAFLLTPYAGVMVDRFDRRKIMMTADLTRGVLALGMLLVRTPNEIWLLYLFSALLVAFASFFGPALNASIPNLVSSDELISANALSSATWGLMLAVGAAVGGVVIAAAGRDAAFVVNSLSFFFSAAMIFSIRKSFGQPAEAQHGAARRSAWQEFRSSLAFMRAYPQVLASALVKTGIGLAGGVILLLTVFSQAVFRIGDAGVGWLYSARGWVCCWVPIWLALRRPRSGQDAASDPGVVLSGRPRLSGVQQCSVVCAGRVVCDAGAHVHRHFVDVELDDAATPHARSDARTDLRD